MEDPYIYIGYIRKSHGVHGEIRAVFSEKMIEFCLEQTFFFVESNGLKTPFKVEEMYFTHENEAIIKFTHFQSPSDTEKYIGSRLFIHQDDLPEVSEDDFYAYELENFKVKDETLGEIGTLEEIIDHGEQSLMKVKNDKNQEVLIPFVEAFILNIDKEKQIIYASIPKELLDLNL